MNDDTKLDWLLVADVDKALQGHQLEMYEVNASNDYEKWRAARTAADQMLMKRLVDLGANVKLGLHHDAVRLAGIRSTCTAGLSGAVANWIDAARKRLEGGAR